MYHTTSANPVHAKAVSGGFGLFFSNGAPAFGFAKVQPFSSVAEALSHARCLGMYTLGTAGL